MRIRRLGAAALVLCLLPVAASAAQYTVSQKVHPDMPSFRFTLDYDQTQYTQAESEQRSFDGEGVFFYVRAITVTREDTGAILQQIALDPLAETYDDETLGFTLEDMNFDGATDMRLMRYVSGGSNSPYYCYLWDHAAQAFVFNEALSAIPSPMFDAQKRQVRGFETRGDMDFTDTTFAEDESAYVQTGRGSEYIDTTYVYDGGALALVSRVTTAYDYGSGTCITTTEQLVDGEMIITGINREPLLQLEGLDFGD